MGEEGAFAAHYLARDGDLAGRLAESQGHRLFAEFAERQPDGGQARHRVSQRGYVVETGHLDVVRHPQPGIAERGDRADGHDVVHGEHT